MRKILFSVCFVALSFWLSAALTEAQSGQPGSADSNTVREAKDQNAKHQSLVQELDTLRDELTVKQAELANLHHKWTVNKGRMPTADEIKTFEEKRAKGPVTVEDNPFINKNPLSSPSRFRAAYFKKLAEINDDEVRVKLLEKELGALKQ
jgi:hypothetical protein